MGNLIDRLEIKAGEKAILNGQLGTITRIIDARSVIFKPDNGSGLVRADIQFLLPTSSLQPQQETVNKEFDLISEGHWKIANERHTIIKPILEGNPTTDEVKEIARCSNVHISTIYRWVERFRQTGKVSSLAPNERSGGKGMGRLDENVELLLKAAIEDEYLNRKRKSINRTVEEVLRRCKTANLPAPHPLTVRRRIDSISEKLKLKSRFGKKVADSKFKPIEGHFPGATHPLAVVQIDHTKMDVILVDEINRKPLDRPWITLAIDVYSRMVVGFYISFDPPGALGTGMCLANAILPKEILLTKLDIQGEWPCWGIMDKIHADNAKEFRGEMLKRVASEYGIDLEWRPVMRPHWGGHIERMMGTMSDELHDLSGTTFSNTQDRKDYPSANFSSMTLRELEVWFTTYVVNVYHRRLHKGINTTPLAKYNEGLFGSASQIGRGLPTRIFNERKVKLDFLPFIERSVQEYGVQVDHIHYYHEILRPWINSIEKDTNKSKQRRKFIFKRDPRDISVIYFFDPELKTYHDIPYRDISHPPITIWEYREAERWLLEQGKKHVDEKAIFEGYEKMRRIEAEAATKTRAARLAKKINRREHSMERSIKNEFQTEIKKEENKPVPKRRDIKPFENIDYGTPS